MAFSICQRTAEGRGALSCPVWITVSLAWAMTMGNGVRLAPALRLNMQLHVLQVMSNDGSGQFRMTTDVQEKLMAAVTSFGIKKALRCLALAYKHHPGNSSKVGTVTICLIDDHSKT